MSDHIPERRLVTDALVEMLRTVTGRPVGAGITPGDDGDQVIAPELPYAIVYPLPGGAFTGTYFAYPDEHSDFLYQVTSVGARQDQAEWMMDAVRVAILGRNTNSTFLHTLTATGLTLADRAMDGGAGAVARHDLIFQGNEDYRIRVLPG